MQANATEASARYTACLELFFAHYASTVVAMLQTLERAPTQEQLKIVG